VIYLLANSGWLVPGVVLGTLVYLFALLLTGALSPVDRAMLAPLVPERLRRRVQYP
jgi:hypothetical protein